MPSPPAPPRPHESSEDYQKRCGPFVKVGNSLYQKSFLDWIRRKMPEVVECSSEVNSICGQVTATRQFIISGARDLGEIKGLLPPVGSFHPSTLSLIRTPQMLAQPEWNDSWRVTIAYQQVGKPVSKETASLDQRASLQQRLAVPPIDIVSGGRVIDQRHHALNAIAVCSGCDPDVKSSYVLYPKHRVLRMAWVTTKWLTMLAGAGATAVAMRHFLIH